MICLTNPAVSLGERALLSVEHCDVRSAFSRLALARDMAAEAVQRPFTPAENAGRPNITEQMMQLEAQREVRRL